MPGGCDLSLYYLFVTIEYSYYSLVVAVFSDLWWEAVLSTAGGNAFPCTHVLP